MTKKLTVLYTHEFELLLEALRRDVRSEQRLASTAEFADVHLRNARDSLRMLEALNPKAPRDATEGYVAAERPRGINA